MKSLRESAASKYTWIVALLGAIGFLNQAIHVDDPYHLGIARRIVATPLDPQGGDLPWNCGTAFGAVPHPPLWSYCEALVGWATQWNDFALHALAALPYFAFTTGFFRLAFRVCDRPLFWTCLVAWSPFILPGRNLMLDMPMLGLWVWAVELQLQAWLDESPQRVWWAGVLAGLAILTKYTALLIPLLFVIGALLFRRPRSLLALAPMALLVASWCLQNYLVYGRIHMLEHVGGAGAVDRSKFDLVDRLRILVRGIGAVVVLAPLFAAAFLDGRIRRWTFVVGSLAAAAAAGWFDCTLVGEELSNGGLDLLVLQAGHYVVFTANGLFVLLMFTPLVYRGIVKPAVSIDKRSQSTRFLLLLWLLAGFAFNLFALSNIAFGAVRHMQSFLVPMVLLASGPVDAVWQRRPRVGWIAWPCLAANAVIGFGLSYADLEIANLHRNFAVEELPKWTGLATTWYVGDPSIRYYGERTASKAFDPASPAAVAEISVGDIVAFPVMQWFGAMSAPLLKNCQVIEVRRILGAVPIRTVDIQVNYYGGSRTSLPWVMPLSNEESGSWLRPTITPLDQIMVYRLVR